MSSVRVRDEQGADRPAVALLIASAFAGRSYASGTEDLIHAALHDAGSVSLVAEERGRIVGQAIFSPVTIDGHASDWHGLGPVAVAPDRQGHGIGTALVADGLGRLRSLGSGGCIVLGNGGYYRRFGFRSPAGLHAPGLPPEHFFVLPFGEEPTGAVSYHPAFGA